MHEDPGGRPRYERRDDDQEDGRHLILDRGDEVAERAVRDDPVTSPSRVRHTDMNDREESTAADDLQPTLERLHGTTRSDYTVLSTLYETHRSELFAFLVRMTRDREAAEDVLQESFIRLIKEARAGRMPDAVRPWLYRVATNEAISRARRRVRWTRLLPRLVDRRVPMPPEGEVERTERQAELNAALARLSPDGRAAMLLAAQGFNGHEIATSIGRTEGATRTLLCRSRVQLRLVLEAEEGRS